MAEWPVWLIGLVLWGLALLALVSGSIPWPAGVSQSNGQKIHGLMAYGLFVTYVFFGAIFLFGALLEFVWVFVKGVIF